MYNEETKQEVIRQFLKADYVKIKNINGVPKIMVFIWLKKLGYNKEVKEIADYITFIHEGKLILSTSKDELIYEYGLMKCRNDEFDKIEKEDIIRYRIKTYEVEILVKDREKMAKKYPNCIVDPTKLDDIMMLYVKGEQI